MHRLRFPVISGLAVVVAFCTGLLTYAKPTPVNQSASNAPLHLAQHGLTLPVPQGWSHRKTGGADELLFLPQSKVAALTSKDLDDAARMTVTSSRQASHSVALDRLQQVAWEQDVAPTYLTIDGWPALQRVTQIEKPTEGDTEVEAAPKMLLYVTTAVAFDTNLVRIDAYIPTRTPTAQALATQAKSLGSSLKFDRSGDAATSTEEIQSIQSKSPPALPTSPKNLYSPAPGASSPLDPQSSSEQAALAVNLGLGNTEPEVAVSTNGKYIVVANAFSYRNSQDGGVTFPNPGGFTSTGGDSSIGFARSGTFYEATIDSTNKPCGGASPQPACNNAAQTMNISTDNGKTFTFQNQYFVCSGNCAFGGVPDQEHIAADRYNPGPAGGDQVYSVWRRPGGYMRSCTSDGGANWTAAVYRTGGTIDFPRITVGQDGAVYVVYVNGNNIEADSYTSCANGFASVVSGASVASSATAVPCPVTGLDRCNDGNDLRSPTIAVDDLNANHIYVAFASNSSNTATEVNENVTVVDSLSSGAGWGGPGGVSQVNNSNVGRRYMPWVCSVGGRAYVSWYDRRNASAPANLDLTDFYAGVAGLDPSGDLAAFGEFQINAPGTSDPNCAPGWACGSRALGDSAACAGTQLAGQCQGGATPTFAACDLTVAQPAGCVNGDTCQLSGGCPKYGDYNGNACAAGRFYSVWGTSTSQPNATPTAGNIRLHYSSKLVCCVPQIQAPTSLTFGACSGASDTQTLNVCNTGKEDLRIDAISSSDTHFTVATPSSGYPVVISHDACFPFSVRYVPTGAGAANAGNLNIQSNDTVNPSVIVSLVGTSGAPSVAVSVASSGAFGEVCGGSQSNLALNILNQGTCDLVITNITSDNGNFLPPTTISYPVTLSHDASLQFPVTFKPTGTCSDSAVTGTFTVFTNATPPTNQVTVSGTQPCPHLNFNPTALTGINAFPATVTDSQNLLGCFSDKQITLSNSGKCSLTISNIVASSALGGFTVVNPTSYPLTIAPGGGTQKVTVRFKPISLTGQVNNAPDDQTGTLTISSNDPNAAGTAGLCGEPAVKSGVRVLVTNSANVPVPSVDMLDLSSKGLNPVVNFTLRPAPLRSGSACGNVYYFQMDNETLVPAGTTGSNPRASYTVKAKVGASQATQSFSLGQCELRQFVLQTK